MKIVRKFSMLALTSWCFTTSAADEEFYRQFLSLAGTNLIAITSPALVNTNNAEAKLTNSILNLTQVCSLGEVAGVHLGMTMQQVANAWGKPPRVWSRCLGGPRFYYED